MQRHVYPSISAKITPKRTQGPYSLPCDRCGTEPVVMTQPVDSREGRRSASVLTSQGLAVTFSTRIQHGNEEWKLSFRIEFGKRSHKVFVTAGKQGSRASLRMPRDRDRIVQLLPYDMWPEFAQSFFAQGEEQTQSERLFES